MLWINCGLRDPIWLLRYPSDFYDDNKEVTFLRDIEFEQLLDLLGRLCQGPTFSFETLHNVTSDHSADPRHSLISFIPTDDERQHLIVARK